MSHKINQFERDFSVKTPILAIVVWVSRQTQRLPTKLRVGTSEERALHVPTGLRRLAVHTERCWLVEGLIPVLNASQWCGVRRTNAKYRKERDSAGLPVSAGGWNGGKVFFSALGNGHVGAFVGDGEGVSSGTVGNEGSGEARCV